MKQLVEDDSLTVESVCFGIALLLDSNFLPHRRDRDVVVTSDEGEKQVRLQLCVCLSAVLHHRDDRRRCRISDTEGVLRVVFEGRVGRRNRLGGRGGRLLVCLLMVVVCGGVGRRGPILGVLGRR